MIRVIFIALLFPTFLSAQLHHDVHASIIGGRFGLVDFNSHKPLGSIPKMIPAVGFTYLKGISSRLDWSISLDGAFSDSASKTRQINKKLLLQGELGLRARIFAPNMPFQPFISSGLGFSSYSGRFGAYLPVGVGLQYQLFSDAWTALNAQYRFTTSGGILPHYFYSIGFYGPLAAHRRVSKPKAVVLSGSVPISTNPDRDNDGLVDSLDQCPDQPGVASANGCPDRDKDGVPDISDKCPDSSGMAKYNGCPMPDVDRDSIADEEDSCPLIFGSLAYKGCPFPDKDMDGIKDELDQCPEVSGSKDNNGCPLISKPIEQAIQKAAKKILFQTGSYKILDSSFKYLDEIVLLLKNEPSLKVSIHGHTDNAGNDISNMQLSINRAKIVCMYLESKGISSSRLEFKGFGENLPIDSNATTLGRKNNRRVDFVILK